MRSALRLAWSKSRRPTRPASIVTSSHDRRHHQVGESPHSLEVIAVLHEARGEKNEGQISLGIDGEAGRAGAEAAKRSRRIENAEEPRDVPLAPHEEADADVGGIEFPMPIASEHVEEDVAKGAGMIPRAEIDHRRRKNPRAVKLAAAAEHLGEAMEVLDRRYTATPWDLASRGGEELTDALDGVRRKERGEPA